MARNGWPPHFFQTGAICLGVALALGLKSHAALISTALVALDLMSSNIVLNPAAQPDFYALAPSLRRFVDAALAAGPYRWFTLSLDGTEGVRYSQWVSQANTDVVAYRVARQSMLGKSAVLDGLESAMEAEHSFAPEGATIDRGARTVANFRQYFPQLRLANVRWVLALEDLPQDLLRLRGLAPIPELAGPLRLYEVPDPLLRAFFVRFCQVEPDRLKTWLKTLSSSFDARRLVLLDAPPPGAGCKESTEGEGGASTVDFEQPDPHTVRLRVRSPAGFVVVVEGFHRDWQAENAQGPVPLLRADTRYWALPTPGGEQTFVVRFRPRWPALALCVAAAALLLAGLGLAKGNPG